MARIICVSVPLLPEDQLWRLTAVYRLDGRLIGISVIDVLPHCVSSVYFIWDPDYAWASLGKLSALRELALVKDMHAAGVDSMRYLYMGEPSSPHLGAEAIAGLITGYWIPSCTKMVYKSEYTPSELLDPDTNVFHELSPKLEAFLKVHPTGYFPFAEVESGRLELSGMGDVSDSDQTPTQTQTDITPALDPSIREKQPKELGQWEPREYHDDDERSEDSDETMDGASYAASYIDDDDDDDDEDEEGDEGEEDGEDQFPKAFTPSFANPASYTEEEIDRLLVILPSRSLLRHTQIVPLGMLQFGNTGVRDMIREMVAAVGMDMVGLEGMPRHELRSRGLVDLG